ncbi:hypothetical protein JK217_08990 [Gluconobacter kondonii]|uniref:hypothetical protein n=1 Tax=Gluconobacter kondonii TaxID=941463 RepID=UPI001B8C3F5D|nr:hypothetical protein [Gluconobacter kondonii]MBS1077886.1 hypothetical protein [Gluconobacter kondonii]
MEFVIFAKITFIGHSDPTITVITSGTQEEHLLQAVRAANRELTRPVKVPENIILQTTVKDQDYTLSESTVGLPKANGTFSCRISIQYALKAKGKFFALSQIYPENML